LRFAIVTDSPVLQVLRTGTNRTSLTNTMMEMKKCCNHPYLVREPDFIPTQNAERLKELVTSSGTHLRFVEMRCSCIM
jgi:SNF2 family DNA or RNA helicase